jgi:formamidopyrimidine-DNA glycosylase
MPELPEVETITRQLNKAVKGKTIADIRVFRTKSLQGNADLLVGKTITKASRKAKII